MKRVAVLLGLFVGALAACGRSSVQKEDASGTASGTTSITAPSTPLEGAPRPGMAWIPPTTLHVGTKPYATPRIADEEMPWTPVEMHGFYIDLLPWPNEPGAIPTTGVSRDEADALCAQKGKRLCTELEWELACKGKEQTTYEYGDAYRPDVCGTGKSVEHSSRQPTGDRAACKSTFGVADMHGLVWEWTSSSWGRNAKDPTLGVLRGGNSVAGELVGRCANALARKPSTKASTMGFRCCAGPKNAQEVVLETKGTPSIAAASPERRDAWKGDVSTVLDNTPIDLRTLRAWTWIPVANEELVIAGGCNGASPRVCALVVGREDDRGDDGVSHVVLAKFTAGRDPAEISRLTDLRHLRFRALDHIGIVSRDITYAYGRIELGPPRRP